MPTNHCTQAYWAKCVGERILGLIGGTTVIDAVASDPPHNTAGPADLAALRSAHVGRELLWASCSIAKAITAVTDRTPERLSTWLHSACTCGWSGGLCAVCGRWRRHYRTETQRLADWVQLGGRR